MNETTKEIDRLLHLATAAERTNDVDSARRRYARCLELDDGSDSLAHYPGRPPVRYAAWVSYAAFLRDQKDLRGALATALPAARRWPDFPDLLLLIGECHRELGELDPAEDAYRRCISMDGPRSTESRVLALSFLADVLERKDRHEEAVQCLHAVLEIEPNNEEALYNIGCGHTLDGDYTVAIDYFHKAIEIDPDYARAHAELGFALLRESRRLPGHEKADTQRAALRHLRRALEIDPADYWAGLYLAPLLWGLGRVREASKQYDAMVRAHPDDPLVLSLGADFLSAGLGAIAHAEARFQRAIEIAPDDPLVRFKYGKHLLRVKRYADARCELELADRLGEVRALGLLSNIESEDDE